LNGVSRTLQVRVELPNQANRLRPGMYGNVVFTGQAYAALSVPSESIIATGKRKIVIVKEAHGYRPVEITSGQERDNFTEVLSGLSEGEEVVASGQFLMDSEASLSGVLTRLSKQDMTMEQELEAESSMSKESKPKESISVEKLPKGRGKVVEVDAKTGKLVLNHEPIEALGWPSMTMGFKVKDNKQLGKLKVGDEVEFDLKADAQEQYIIVHIEKSAVKTDSEKEVKP
jgi:Cu(I)/Ag(I) efflux system membrane fusion protein